MKNIKIRLIALFLILPLLLVSITSCGQIDFGLSDHTTNEASTNNSDTDISGSGNTNSQNPGNIVATSWYEYETDTETFVYGLVVNELSVYYDVYSAVITLSSGEEVYGIGFTDYSEAFELEDGSKTLFSSGFVSFCGEPSIPQEEYESGIEIKRLDNDDDEYGFVYAFSREPFASHCVVFDEYITYGITEKSEIFFTEQTYDKEYLRENFDESLGTLYSYDEERVLNDLNVGEYVPLGGVSLSDEIDFTALEAEINRIIEEQNYNFSTVDVATAVYIAQDALNAYLLSLQEETFMGYRVEDLVELSKQIDPTSCIRITADGFELVDIQPTPPPSPSGLMKWLTGIVAGIAVVGGIVLSVYGMPHLGGTIIGAAVEVFTEVVIENKTLENVDWRKVAIASVAGAISANLGLLGDSVVGGATNATFTLIDGGSLGDVANSFAIGTAAGLALGGAFKLAGKGVQKIANKISSPPKVVKVSVVDDALNLDGKIANKVDDPVVDATTYQAKKQAGNILDSQVMANKLSNKVELYKVLDLDDNITFSNPAELQQALSKLTKSDINPNIDFGNENKLYRNLYGKYTGVDANGQPYRIRIELHSETPGFNGVENPYHTQPHYHIDRRLNGTTGKWQKQYTGLLEDLFK